MSQAQQAEKRVGTVIGGKWRVDALLGSGSMAAVYGVTHRNGARAALKILHPTLCTDPSVCERFLGEGYLANSVKHQGIVRVLDDGITDDGCVFLTMDLLEGSTLEELRQKRGNRISLIETLDLSDKLMDALSAVHTAGIIHRDLKPQNVFVCDDGTVKLLDFGVARVFDRTSQSKLSMFGLVLGTPSFMSPEQALGSRDKVDHRSDIWSLGATMFTALTGETVHLGANIQAKLLAAATVKARSITMVMPDLPPAIANAIDMALRFKKEDRWQSTDAMRRAIRGARQELGLGKPQSIAPPAFDMSLDESTHVDKGSKDFDGSATLAVAAPATAQTQDGTFIGIGDEKGNTRGVVGNDGSVPPGSLPPPLPGNRSMTPGNLALPTTTQAMSVPNPPMRPRMMTGPEYPGLQEGSIPAYGGTVKFGADDSVSDIDPATVGARRKGTVAVWIAAVLLAAAALGGIAFFAVKQQQVGKDPEVPGTAPLTTGTIPSATVAPSAVVPPGTTVAPTNTTMMELPASPGADAGVKVVPVRPANQPATPAWALKPPKPVVAQPPQPTPGNNPKPDPDPAPQEKPAPKPTNTAGDPFNTPE